MHRDRKSSLPAPDGSSDKRVKEPSEHVCDRTVRNLAGTGCGTPVLMTSMSRPAFGIQCLPNMLRESLHESDTIGVRKPSKTREADCDQQLPGFVEGLLTVLHCATRLEWPVRCAVVPTT